MVLICHRFMVIMLTELLFDSFCVLSFHELIFLVAVPGAFIMLSMLKMSRSLVIGYNASVIIACISLPSTPIFVVA